MARKLDRGAFFRRISVGTAPERPPRAAAVNELKAQIGAGRLETQRIASRVWESACVPVCAAAAISLAALAPQPRTEETAA